MVQGIRGAIDGAESGNVKLLCKNKCVKGTF